MLTAEQLRKKYLDFFSKRGHAVTSSVSLVPANDPTTLFTTAGMQAMMPYLLGEPHPKGKRITNSQRCFRSQDIEEVGDNRHTTFFEMLGNWSLGDYFKEEQLRWFFQFLIEEVQLPAENLYVSVFAGSNKYQIEPDKQSARIWQNLFAQQGITAEIVENPRQKGLNKGRIFYYSADKNWWSRNGNPDQMPVGEPGGPDSEVFYDFGPNFKFHEKSKFADQPCHINCDCGRFLEIGNSVFMQYQKTKTGFKELPQKNIDFGGGLERILAAAQQQPDIFQTDLFLPLIKKIEQTVDKKYQQNKVSFRIISDHMKAAVMLISDGVKPSNKDRGYLVRRLLRRAARYNLKLTDDTQVLTGLVPVTAELYAEVKPAIKRNQAEIETVITQEIDKFKKTLNRGLRKLSQEFTSKQKLTGQFAYDLYQTYGFPLEMTIEEAKLNNIQLDKNLAQDFKQAKSKHAQISKKGSEQKFKGGLADESEVTTSYHTTTHLLHSALRKILGQHVKQQGSHINRQRLRFDFSHSEALTKEQLQAIEDLVNDWIEQDLPVKKKEMPKKAALKSGALAFFAERYPDPVTVYQIGQDKMVSQELCGGPHVHSTGELSPIEIFKEKSASAGVRRVYVRHKTPKL